MATTTATVSEQTYRDLALNDPDRRWELWDGVLVEKPPMSVMHDDLGFQLGRVLQNQLDLDSYRVSVNGARLRYTARNYFIPDVAVVSASLVMSRWDDPMALNDYPDPVLFVAEVWSRTTGDYDFAAKLPIYRQRGDHEIWAIHPYERTLSARRRQPDGSYSETLYTGGIVPILSLPGVTIDFDALLDGREQPRRP